jgi:hypothetical protein
MIEARWMAVVLVLSGCPGEKLGRPPAGGVPDASVGTVTFQVDIPSTAGYCDQVGPCSGSPAHIAITDSAGRSYGQMAPFFCSCSETTCIPWCLTIFCGGPGYGVAVTAGNQVWQGVYYAASDRCGASCGDVPHYLPPGPYIAQLCATPGTMSTVDGGQPVCTRTGDPVCGPTVPFIYPSATPIVLTLAAPDGSVTIDAR